MSHNDDTDTDGPDFPGQAASNLQAALWSDDPADALLALAEEFGARAEHNHAKLTDIERAGDITEDDDLAKAWSRTKVRMDTYRSAASSAMMAAATWDRRQYDIEFSDEQDD